MEDFDFDSLLDDIDNIYVKEKEEIPEPEIEDVIEEPKNLEKQKEQMEKIVTKKGLQKIQYPKDLEELTDEVISYVEDISDLKNEIKALQEQIKERKQEAKEIGIKVGVIDKAFKEVVSEMKETPEDAQYLAGAKDLIMNNVKLAQLASFEASK